MSSRGIFILAITWIVMSPFWFWAENIALGIIWLCGGVIELFIALVRRSKVQFTMPSGLHSVLERPFSEANGRPFLVKRSPLIVC